MQDGDNWFFFLNAYKCMALQSQWLLLSKGGTFVHYGNKFIFGRFGFIMPKFALNWVVLEHVPWSPHEPLHVLFQKPYYFWVRLLGHALRQVIASTFGLYWNVHFKLHLIQAMLLTRTLKPMLVETNSWPNVPFEPLRAWTWFDPSYITYIA